MSCICLRDDHQIKERHPDCIMHGYSVPPMQEAVDHPSHYGGADNPYEAIKVIEAWDLGFHLGNTVKYICRAGKKSALLEDLKKARWYLDRAVAQLEGGGRNSD